MRLLVEATTALAFGRELGDVGGDAIQRHLDRVFTKLMSRLTAPAPYWRLVRLPSDRAVDDAVAQLRGMFEGLIAEERAWLAGEGKGAAPRSFMAAMLAARDEDGAAFDEPVIFGNLVQILMAGEDTTANTISWAVHHLCDAPDDVTALRAEAERVLGDARVPPTLEAAQALAYAGACANEAMRLRPVLPVHFFTANEGADLPGLRVEAGEHLIVLTRPAGLDPRDVARPMEFAPERWSDLGVAAEWQKRGVYVPFGSGARLCAGRTLALLEMRVVLGALYRNFHVERVGRSEDVSEELQMTMRPVGLRVRLRPH